MWVRNGQGCRRRQCCRRQGRNGHLFAEDSRTAGSEREPTSGSSSGWDGSGWPPAARHVERDGVERLDIGEGRGAGRENGGRGQHSYAREDDSPVGVQYKSLGYRGQPVNVFVPGRLYPLLGFLRIQQTVQVTADPDQRTPSAYDRGRVPASISPSYSAKTPAAGNLGHQYSLTAGLIPLDLTLRRFGSRGVDLPMEKESGSSTPSPVQLGFSTGRPRPLYLPRTLRHPAAR